MLPDRNMCYGAPHNIILTLTFDIELYFSIFDNLP